MLNSLYEIEKNLATHLEDKNSWKSLYIDYDKPYIKTLYKTIGEHTVYLTEICFCHPGEIIPKSSPWPFAMKIISGSYEMTFGFSKVDTISHTTKLILSRDSYYEGTDIQAKHGLRALEKNSFALVVTGKPWSNKKYNYPLRHLANNESNEIFNAFNKAYTLEPIDG